MYFFLLLYPIAKASGTVLFRMLKKMESKTILSWQNFLLMVLSYIYLQCTGGSIAVIKDFSTIDWTAFVITSVCIVLTNYNFS